jgi:DNA repair exonuclease SbcCD ATPase subunit
MAYLRLPDNSYFPIAEGESPKEAREAARKAYPKAFMTEGEIESKQGFLPAASDAFKRAKAGTYEAAGKLFNNETLKDLALKEQKELEEKPGYLPTTEEDRSAAFKKGLGSGIGALAREYISEPVGGIVGRYGVPLAVGAGASLAAPAVGLGAFGTAVAGGAATALADYLPQVGENLERQRTTKQPEDLQAAALTGIPQAALSGLNIRLGMLPKPIQNIFKADAAALEKQVLAGLLKPEQAIAQLTGNLKNMLLSTGSAAVVGAGTMGAEELLRRQQAGQSLTDDAAIEDYKDIGIGALAIAPLFGIPRGMGKRGAEKRGIEKASQTYEVTKGREERARQDAEAAALADQQAAEKEARDYQQAVKDSFGAPENAAAGVQGRTGDLFGGTFAAPEGALPPQRALNDNLLPREREVDAQRAVLEQQKEQERVRAANLKQMGGVYPEGEQYYGQNLAGSRAVLADQKLDALNGQPAFSTAELARKQQVLTGTVEDLQTKAGEAVKKMDYASAETFAKQAESLKKELAETNAALRKAGYSDLDELQKALATRLAQLKKAADLGDSAQIAKLAPQITEIQKRIAAQTAGPKDLISGAVEAKAKEEGVAALNAVQRAKLEQAQKQTLGRAEDPAKGIQGRTGDMFGNTFAAAEPTLPPTVTAARAHITPEPKAKEAKFTPTELVKKQNVIADSIKSLQAKAEEASKKLDYAAVESYAKQIEGLKTELGVTNKALKEAGGAPKAAEDLPAMQKALAGRIAAYEKATKSGGYGQLETLKTQIQDLQKRIAEHVDTPKDLLGQVLAADKTRYAGAEKRAKEQEDLFGDVFGKEEPKKDTTAGLKYPEKQGEIVTDVDYKQALDDLDTALKEGRPSKYVSELIEAINKYSKERRPARTTDTITEGELRAQEERADDARKKFQESIKVADDTREALAAAQVKASAPLDAHNKALADLEKAQDDMRKANATFTKPRTKAAIQKRIDAAQSKILSDKELKAVQAAVDAATDAAAKPYQEILKLKQEFAEATAASARPAPENRRSKAIEDQHAAIEEIRTNLEDLVTGRFLNGQDMSMAASLRQGLESRIEAQIGKYTDAAIREAQAAREQKGQKPLTTTEATQLALKVRERLAVAMRNGDEKAFAIPDGDIRLETTKKIGTAPQLGAQREVTLRGAMSPIEKELAQLKEPFHTGEPLKSRVEVDLKQEPDLLKQRQIEQGEVLNDALADAVSRRKRTERELARADAAVAREKAAGTEPEQTPPNYYEAYAEKLGLPPLEKVTTGRMTKARFKQRILEENLTRINKEIKDLRNHIDSFSNADRIKAIEKDITAAKEAEGLSSQDKINDLTALRDRLREQVNPDKEMIAKVEAEIAKIKPDAAGAERLASEKRRAFEQQLLETATDNPNTRERNLKDLLAKVEKQAEPDADVVKRLNKEIEKAQEEQKKLPKQDLVEPFEQIDLFVPYTQIEPLAAIWATPSAFKKYLNSAGLRKIKESLGLIEKAPSVGAMRKNIGEVDKLGRRMKTLASTADSGFPVDHNYLATLERLKQMEDAALGLQKQLDDLLTLPERIKKDTSPAQVIVKPSGALGIDSPILAVKNDLATAKANLAAIKKEFAEREAVIEKAENKLQELRNDIEAKENKIKGLPFTDETQATRAKIKERRDALAKAQKELVDWYAKDQQYVVNALDVTKAQEAVTRLQEINKKIAAAEKNIISESASKIEASRKNTELAQLNKTVEGLQSAFKEAQKDLTEKVKTLLEKSSKNEFENNISRAEQEIRNLEAKYRQALNTAPQRREMHNKLRDDLQTRIDSLLADKAKIEHAIAKQAWSQMAAKLEAARTASEKTRIENEAAKVKRLADAQAEATQRIITQQTDRKKQIEGQRRLEAAEIQSNSSSTIKRETTETQFKTRDPKKLKKIKALEEAIDAESKKTNPNPETLDDLQAKLNSIDPTRAAYVTRTSAGKNTKVQDLSADAAARAVQELKDKKAAAAERAGQQTELTKLLNEETALKKQLEQIRKQMGEVISQRVELENKANNATTAVEKAKGAALLKAYDKAHSLKKLEKAEQKIKDRLAEVSEQGAKIERLLTVVGNQPGRVQTKKLTAREKELHDLPGLFADGIAEGKVTRENQTQGEVRFTMENGLVARMAEAAESRVDAGTAATTAAALDKAAPKDVKVTSVGEYSELPARVKKLLADSGIEEGSPRAAMVRGFVTPDGEVFIVRNNHSSVKELERTYAHEIIGHAGVDRILGQEGMEKLADRIRTQDGGAYELASKLGADVRKNFDGSMADYALSIEAMRRRGEPQAKIDEAIRDMDVKATQELIAYTAELRVDENLRTKAGRWMKEIVGMVRQWLRDHGFAELSKVTTSDIYNIIRQSQRNFNRGELGAFREVNGQVSFSSKAIFAEGFDAGMAAATGKIIAQQKGIKDRIKGSVTGMSMMTRMVDRFAPLDYIARNMKDRLEGVQMMYNNRIYDQRNNMLAEIATHGSVGYKKGTDGTYQYKSRGGPSLKDVFETAAMSKNKVGNGQATTDFFGMYLAMERAASDKNGLAEGLNKLDFEGKVDIAEANRILNFGRNDANFQKARKQYREYNNGLIDLMVETGRLAERDFEAEAKMKTLEQEGKKNTSQYREMKRRAESAAVNLKDGDYVPYYRENAKGELWDTEHNIRIGDLKTQAYLKELIGGDSAIVNFETGALQNTYMLTDMAMSNIATKNTVFTLNKLGIADIRPGDGPAAPNVLRFYDNGVQKHAVIETKGAYVAMEARLEAMREDGKANTPEYKKLRERAEASRMSEAVYGDIPAELLVKGMEGVATATPLVVAMMRGPANLLRKAITRNPVYAARVALKDSISGWITSGADVTPVLGVLGNLRKSWKGGSPEVRSLQSQGIIGGHVFTGTMSDMRTIAQQIAQGQTGWEKLWAGADRLAITADEASRVTLYNGFIKKGMSEMEATLATLESQNFTKHGFSPSMRMLSTMIPFFNAQITGLNTFISNLSGKSLFEDKLGVKATMLKRGAILAGTTMIYSALMQNNEAYKNATEQDKLNYWFIPLPFFDEPIRVPIPFESGTLFKAIPEALFNLSTTDAKAKDVLPAVGKLVLNAVPGMSNLGLPQGIKPIIEAATNTNLFTMSPIEGQRQLAKEAGQRANTNTTEASKMFGEALGVSPIMIDHFVNAYTSAAGIALLSMFNPMLQEVGTPESKASQLPLIGGVFQPTNGSGMIDKAYKDMAQIERINTTFKEMAEQNPEKAERYLEKNLQQIDSASAAGKFKKDMGELNKEERLIRSDRQMTREQKAKELEEIKQLKVEIAKEFMSISRE